MFDDFSSDDSAFADDTRSGSSTTGDDGVAQDANIDEILVTKEGLKKLKEELDHLKNVRRKEVSQRLKEAISYGDLSENSEYEEAKNEQAFVEGRILELEEKVKHAKIIAEKKATSTEKEVNIGSTVTVRCPAESDEPQTYTIVGATEADPFAHKISNESPMGKSLLGSCKGKTVRVTAPSGVIEYDIIKVS